MPFPSEVTTREITHHYTDPDSGNPCSGRVTLAPSSVMMYPGGTIVRSSITVLVPGDTGDLSIVVPTNDDPDISPLNTHYLLTENMLTEGDPQQWVRINRVRVPSGVGPIDIADLIPVPADDGGSVPIIRGPKGDPGTPGTPGGSITVWDQSTPSATWSMPHGISVLVPKVSIVLTGDDGPCFTDLSFVPGVVVAEFPDPCTGKAYIS